MSRILAISAMVITALSVTATPALAQQPDQDSGRLTLGIARQGGVFGDDDPRSTSGWGMSVGLHARHQMSSSKAFVTDFSFQPVAVTNPHFDERVRTLSVQLGVEFGHRLYVRPSGGIGLGFWTGEFASSALDLTPSIGVAIGHQHGFNGRRVVSPEFFVRAGGRGGVATWIAGVQLGLGR